MSSALLLVVALLAEGAAPALPREPPDPVSPPVVVLPARARELRERATRAYRAKDYRAACELFASAVKLAPAHADLQDELGLCLARLGRKQDALAAHWRAVSAGGLETRRRAYFNLSSLGVELTPPAPGVCAPLAAPPWCARTLHACGFDFSVCGRVCSGGEGARIYNLGTPSSEFSPNAVMPEDVRGWQEAFRAASAGFGCSLYTYGYEDESGCGLDAVNTLGRGHRAMIPDEPQQRLERLSRRQSSFFFSPPPAVFDLVLRHGGVSEEEGDVEVCRLIMADGCSGLVAVRCRGGNLEGVHEFWLDTIEEEEPADAGTPTP